MAYFNGRSFTSFRGINLTADNGAIRFVTPGTTPTTTSGERLLYVNSSNQLIFDDGSTATTLGSAGSVANFSLDDAYDDGRNINADSGAVNVNSSGAGGGLAITDTGTGARLTFAGAGTGNDITASNWSVTNAGGILVTGTAGLIRLDDNLNLTFGDDSDATIDWESGNAVLNVAGAVDFDNNVTLAASATITQAGAAGSTVLTVTAGDAVMSDGSLAITDADNAASLTVTNSTATITQAGVLLVVANGVTSGTVIRSESSAAGLTTGNYFDAYDGSAVIWEVGDNGATTIAGNGGDNVLTLTAGDAVLSDGALTITDADDAASFSVTNNSAATASLAAIAGSGTFTGSTTTSFFTVTPSGLTSGTGLYLVGAALDTGILADFATDATQTTGTILRLQSTGANSANTSGRGLLVDHRATAVTSTVNKITDWVSVASNRTVTTGTVADDFDMVSLVKTSEINGAGSMSETGSVLRVENAVTNTSGTVTSTSKGIEVVMDSLGTGDGVEITHAATGGIALDIIGAATTVHDVLITTTGVKANNVGALGVTNSGATAAGGSILRVTNTGTPAAATSYLVDFDYSGATMTNNPVGVYINGGSSTESALEVVNSGAIANNVGALDVNTSGAIAAGGAALRVVNSGTPAAASSYLAEFDYSGATMTNNPVAVVINAGGTTAAALQLTSSGAAGANQGLLELESTNTGAVGPVLSFAHTSTGSAANADVVGRILFDGLDNADAVESYGRIDVVISDVTAANPDGEMNFLIDVAGTLTQRLQVSNAINGIEVGDGAAAALVSSNGAFDLTLETNNGAANEPTIVLTDGATGNVTITAGGTSGEIDLVSPVLMSSTQAITGAGAINLTTCITELNTTGGGAYTLADGVEGQLKLVVLDVDSGTDAVITPTNMAGGTTLTFADQGDATLLLFTSGEWFVVGNNGGTIA